MTVYDAGGRAAARLVALLCVSGAALLWLAPAAVAQQNDPPLIANDDAVSTDEDTPLSIPAPGVLANDTDVDGDPLTGVTAVLVSGPAHGTLTLNADGSFQYTPDANFNGTDSFTYRANDGAADSNVATVGITVNAVNDAPFAVDDSVSTDEDTPLSIPAPGVLANDTDVDGDPLTAVLVSGPTHGTLTLNADGSFQYTPDVNFNGTDSFTYKANDGAADSNVATVGITVNAVNDVEDLIGLVEALDLPHGTERSLLAKLEGAQRDIDAGDTDGACAKLAAFINQVRAQRGHRIAEADADALIAEAEAIRDSLGCA